MAGNRHSAHGTKGTRIGIASVLHTGRELDVSEAISLPDFASFQFPHPLDVALRIRRVAGGLELRGTLAGLVAGECARCLESVALPVHVDVNERFDPGSDPGNPLGEGNVLAGDELDLQDLARQLIDSALPIVLLCSDTCPGLCADCGEKRDGSTCCTHSGVEDDG